MKVSVVIPSYQRGATAVDSIRALLALDRKPDQIILVDQTGHHPLEVERVLQSLHDCGDIAWSRLTEPSIPKAMNFGLRLARSKVVLFLDDDIVPDAKLVEMHAIAHSDHQRLVAGMVLQPGEKPETLVLSEGFRFNSSGAARIREFMGGNFSIDRETAITLGGFDENFVGAAYRFEAEFAHRFVAKHGLIGYEPRAIIHHLQIPTGGTRAHGHHLRTSRPAHSVGAYYFLLRTRQAGWLWQLIWRPLRSVRTRHHLQKPWWIPLTLLAELRGFIWALKLLLRGPKLIGKLGE